jgi:hypothetical protein
MIYDWIEMSMHRNSEFLNYATAGGGTAIALLGAFSADQISAWGGALIAVAAAFWGLYRDQRRRDKEEIRTEQALQAIQDANLKALAENRPIPHPDFLPKPPKP